MNSTGKVLIAWSGQHQMSCLTFERTFQVAVWAARELSLNDVREFSKWVAAHTRNLETQAKSVQRWQASVINDDDYKDHAVACTSGKKEEKRKRRKKGHA